MSILLKGLPNLVKKLKKLFSDLAKDFDRQENAGYDLWTHLPSYKAAVAAHGDYAVEYKPSIADIMIEPAMFLSDKMEVVPDMIPDKAEWYSCPCGQEH
ncbi:hypothetical protein ACS91_02020 [Vibrio parahaemolyticus]|uniref:hypothetical protein n=1 Tax=Vibrio parahaemolyticus TaxID=670 RepID=UPI0006A5B545|nr:hypothetical protein ACS91_02020 [Vibrio parahaemolyticus]